jgi:hypothetical protein
LNSLKNIVTWTVKIALGLGSAWLIYWRLSIDLDAAKIELLKENFSSGTSFSLFIACILLIPLNWGIESYKWHQVAQPVEKISFPRAMRSVYAGICVGNFAPGRATEFLAKILFFLPENRPTITLLHFANGMFQLALTIIFGVAALLYKLQSTIELGSATLFFVLICCGMLLVFFFFFIFRFEFFQKWIAGLFSKRMKGESLPYHFSKQLIIKLFILSFLRYLVFTAQFLFILWIMTASPVSLSLITSICIYFLFTTALPMISFIEAAIRATIALFVFAGSGISESSLIITAVLLWIINIVIPSIIGYLIILKEKFVFADMKK